MKNFVIAFLLLHIPLSFANSPVLKDEGTAFLCQIKITEKDVALNMRRLDNFENYVFDEGTYNSLEVLTDRVNYFVEVISKMKRDGFCQ